MKDGIMARLWALWVSKFVRFVGVVRELVTRGNRGGGVSQGTDDGGKNRYALRIWTLVLGISLFVALVTQVSLRELWSVLSQADVRYVWAAVLAELGVTVLRTIRYGLFFAPRERWLDLYGAFQFLRVLNYILPFRSGEVVSLSVLKKYHLSPSIAETASVWLFLRVTDVTALSILFTLVLGITSLPGMLEERLEWVRWVFLGVSAGLITGMVYLPVWVSRFQGEQLGSWVSQRLCAFRAGLERIRSIRVYLQTLGLATLIWGGLIMVNTCVQLAFGTPLQVHSAIVVSIAHLAISLLPVHAPLAIGTGDAAWAGLMMILGVDAARAITIAISIRLLITAVMMTEGLIGLSLLSAAWNRNSC